MTEMTVQALTAQVTQVCISVAADSYSRFFHPPIHI
jgi:hypothetical protein